jgi:dihydroorotate dehydrogenase (fumarate)
MDLRTRYLGFTLEHPLIPGASPLVDNLDTVRRLEDAGAPMIVMHSLFEEQLTREQVAMGRAIEAGDETYAEATSYLPRRIDFTLGPDQYLEQIRRIKASVRVPVVGSLNGTSEGGWLSYAQLIQQAGADALELNLYELATRFAESAAEVEDRAVRIAEQVRRSVTIPVAVKLSPFYTALPHFARRLEGAGADGLVLFNRFYQPDYDLEYLELKSVVLSSSAELQLRLRWVAILSERIKPSLAITGGVHQVEDVVKAVMAGAHAVQVVSALLQQGPSHLRTLRDGLARWLDERDYESLGQMQGSMNLTRCPDPRLYERTNYVKLLQSWRASDD